MSKQQKIDKMMESLAKQLQKIRKAKAEAIRKHDDAEHDWWATIPDGMRSHIEEAYSKLGQSNEAAPQT